MSRFLELAHMLNAAKLSCLGWGGYLVVRGGARLQGSTIRYPKKRAVPSAYNDLFRKRRGQESQESHSEWNQVAWHTSPGQPDSTWMLSETTRAYRC